MEGENSWERLEMVDEIEMKMEIIFYFLDVCFF
jgi:hypothetical protein